MSLFDSILGHASEISVEKAQIEFQPLLIEGEHLEKVYKLIRDLIIFTNKRLILVDKQGITGSKAEYHTIPYSSVIRFSKESAGLLDLDAELKIWVKGMASPIQKHFKKGDNINEIYMVLSKHILK